MNLIINKIVKSQKNNFLKYFLDSIYFSIILERFKKKNLKNLSYYIFFIFCIVYNALLKLFLYKMFVK